MTTVAIIPARYASTRLPGKPLLADTGKPLIQHVWERVKQAEGLDRVLIATDDERIASACDAFGAEVVMTRDDHPTGTDRLAEVVERLRLDDDDIAVNVQGDEPDVPPECVSELADLLTRIEAPMATLATPLAPAEAGNPNKVKVVCNLAGLAMYFSRAPIPWDRDGAGRLDHFLHLGMYAYRAGFLRVFTRLPQTSAERAEKLEQLRALEHGHSIAVGVVQYDGHGIDTPEDYAAFVKRWRGQPK